MNALYVGTHALEHLPSDRDPFSDSVLLGFRAGGSHPFNNSRWHNDTGNLVSQELRVSVRHEWPDAGDDGNPGVLDGPQELLELADVEHRLGNRVFRAGFDLPLEPLELLGRIESGRIHADADRELRRRADGISAGIQAVLQLAHQ